MSADFTPGLSPYKETGTFRFWCQKVLPLVYDDSLSYYELLCKVVNYLNDVISNVDGIRTDTEALREAYIQLQNYVNNYFDNLDVQQEINTKLDEMATNGDLTALIAPLVPDAVSEWLQEYLTPTSPPVDPTLQISGAAADAKATGDAIRAEDAVLKSALGESGIIYNPSHTLISGAIRGSDGTVIGDAPNYHTSDIFVPANSEIKVNAYNYAGLAFIAIVNNGAYSPVVVATENERVTSTYTTDKDINVSIGVYGENYDILIIRKYDDVIAEESEKNHTTLKRNGIDNSFDGVLYRGYWNGDMQLVSNSIDVCNKNKIPCSPLSTINIEAESTIADPTYYISYYDDNTRIRRDTGTGWTYSGIAPEGTKHVCFLFEKSGLNTDNVTNVTVFVNNTIFNTKKDLGYAIRKPTYTILEGIINDAGSVLASSPNSHTSDIAIKTGDTIIVNGYYYAGHSIISKHEGSYYIPLIVASASERVTARYAATEDMNISVSFISSYPWDIFIEENNCGKLKADAYSLNSIVDVSAYLWELGSLDGSGVEYDSNTRVRSEMIPVNEGTIISVSGAPNSMCVFMYDEVRNLIGENEWISGNAFTIPSNVAYVRMLLRVNNSNPTIPSADISIIRDRCAITLKLPKTAYFEKTDEIIPSYYSSMMAAKANQIRLNSASIGFNGDSFIFFTDFHIDSNTLHTPMLIKYLMDNCGIENVVFCGDAINKESSKANVYEKFIVFNQFFKSHGVNFKTVVGNHEFNNPSESTDPEDVAIQLTNGEIYPFFVKDEEYDPFAVVDASELAYYIDNKTQKIRYLFIPCDYAANITAGAQQFALDSISSLPSDYSVLVFTHYALQTDGNMRASFVPIANALDALIGTDNIPICVITGHTHRDLDGTTQGGIPIICTTCDSNIQVLDPSLRPAGTVNEQAFDVFQIDKTNRTILVVRIGYGTDRTFAY